MKKIFSPINRWQFFVATSVIDLLFYTLNYSLVTIFVLCACFLWSDNAYINFLFPILPAIFYVIIKIFIAFKRLFDIYGNIKKALAVTVFGVTSWFIALIILMKPYFNTFIEAYSNYNIDKLIQFQSDSMQQTCFWVMNIIFFIFLAFIKGLNDKDKLKVKTIFIRTVSIALAWVIIVISATYINRVVLSLDFMSIVDYKMAETIEIRDTALAYKNFKHESLKRFDVIDIKDYDLSMYNTPMRIIGLPNEKIEIKNNEIYVNNELIEDKYGYYAEKLMPVNINKTVTLDNNSYFVMGDNRYWQKGGKYISRNKKTGEETWKDIYKDEIAYTVSKDKITGKIIAINYKDFSKEDADIYGYEYDENQKRNKTGIVILTKDKTLELNPSQLSLNMFGKNIKK